MTGVDSFDGRSDDKGAEPEGLAMAEIDGRCVLKSFQNVGLKYGVGRLASLIHPPASVRWEAGTEVDSCRA